MTTAAGNRRSSALGPLDRSDPCDLDLGRSGLQPLRSLAALALALRSSIAPALDLHVFECMLLCMHGVVHAAWALSQSGTQPFPALIHALWHSTALTVLSLSCLCRLGPNRSVPLARTLSAWPPLLGPFRLGHPRDGNLRIGPPRIGPLDRSDPCDLDLGRSGLQPLRSLAALALALRSSIAPALDLHVFECMLLCMHGVVHAAWALSQSGTQPFPALIHALWHSTALTVLSLSCLYWLGPNRSVPLARTLSARSPLLGPFRLGHPQDGNLRIGPLGSDPSTRSDPCDLVLGSVGPGLLRCSVGCSLGHPGAW